MFVECVSGNYWSFVMDRLSLNIPVPYPLPQSQKQRRGPTLQRVRLWEMMAREQQAVFIAYLERVEEIGQSGAKEYDEQARVYFESKS